MSHTTLRARRGRVTTIALTTVLALGVGLGASACASSAGGSTGDDQVAAANAAAAKEADIAADTYQKLSTSVTEARDLATEATGKVADKALLDNLTTTTDAARAINPVATYHDVATVDEAKAKLAELQTVAYKTAAAKNALDAAITSVKNAEG